MAVIGIAFSVFGLIALATESAGALLLKSWVYLWFGYLSWLLFWNPSVRVSDSGVIVDNVFKKTTLNWSAISRIDTKYSLSLETKRGTIRAWAAPAPSRYAGFMASRTESKHLPESSYIGEGLIRPGDLTSSDSGVAALVIRRHWETLRDSGALNKQAEVVIQVLHHRYLLLVALSLAAVIGFVG
jgi:hypothetical protein